MNSKPNLGQHVGEPSRILQPHSHRPPLLTAAVCAARESGKGKATRRRHYKTTCKDTPGDIARGMTGDMARAMARAMAGVWLVYGWCMAGGMAGDMARGMAEVWLEA